jgi:hypothetical protein
MRKRRQYVAATVSALLLLLVPAIGAAEDTASFDGEFRIGYRSVDVGGTETKYKEDLNLEDGPRLFELRFDLVPSEGLRQYADRVQLDLTNFGGDPFESFRLAVQKYGRYDFRYQRTESIYFYEDIILPVALADPRLSSGGDFHHFNFERVRDTASLKLHFNPRATLNVGFNRYTKVGESTTTLDVQRDEFEFDRPIDESYYDFNVGFEYSWSKVTLILEERWREYDNLVEIFLPGQSLGENATNATILDFFFLDQPYSFDSQQHVVRLNANPTEKLLITASAIVQSLDLDVEAEESSAGIGFTGAPFTTDAEGSGEIDRDSDLFDVDVSYLVTDRVAIIGAVRQHSLDQEGSFVYEGELNFGTWDIETTGVDLGVEVTVSPQVVISGGLRYESRDVDFGIAAEGDDLETEQESTDHDGFFVNVAWRPSKVFRLDGEFEDSSYDDPFTLTSPTDRQRYRVRAQAHMPSGFYFQGSVLAHRYENDTVDWQSDRDQYTLRLGYVKDALNLTFGYSVIEIDRSVDQIVTTAPGFGGGVMFDFPILYEADADFFDGRIRYKASERFTLGGDFRLYDNSGTFGISRDDFRGWVEIGFAEDYYLHLGYRTIDYDEDDFDFDDYDADIAEISIGYRW